MAEIIDQEEELVEVSNEAEVIPEQTNPDPLEQLSVEAQEPTPEPEPEEDELPEAYRGKSIKDVVAMHASAQEMIGKQSAEVGELRQFVDGYLKGSKPTDPVAEAPEEVPDFFENPEASVQRAIENHPAVQAAQHQARTNNNQAAISQLQEKHSDMAQLVADPTFTKWVSASPVRKELYERADQGYDAASADELFTNFKAQRAVAFQTINSDKQSRAGQVKAASTGSARGSAASNTGSKVYRRSDLIKLMVSDPTRYEALSDEILKAYSEGRVK